MTKPRDVREVPYLRLVRGTGPASDRNADASPPTVIVEAQARPCRTVDLDRLERAAWRLPADAVGLWRRRRWRLEELGCAVCQVDDVRDRLTISTCDDGIEWIECKHHGPLHEVPYYHQVVNHVVFGDVERTQVSEQRDGVLIPVDLSYVERRALLETFARGVVPDEAAPDAAADDDDQAGEYADDDYDEDDDYDDS